MFLWMHGGAPFKEGAQTMHTSDGAELAVVSDNDARAAAIKARRVRLGLSKPKAAAESKRLGFNIDRGTFTSAESGGARDDTYERIDAFYDAFEEEGGKDDGDDLASESGMVTVKLAGNFGVSVTVQGPVGDRDEVQAIALTLLREMRADPAE